MVARSASLAALLIASVLAGCAGSPPATPAETPLSDGALPPLTPDTQVAAPLWVPGQWWTVTHGGEAVDDTTPYTMVVTQAGAGGYEVASDQESRAKLEAAYNSPFLGTFTKADLGMVGWSQGSTPWTFLSFPLEDGKTWGSAIPNIAWDILPDTVALQLTATFDDALGEGGGYRIVGTADGHTLVEATYLPESGWYQELTIWDVDPGQEAVEFSLQVAQHGHNFTGTLYTATATQLLAFLDSNGFDDDPTAGGQPVFNPDPMHEFTVQGGEGHFLFGYIYAFVILGGRVTELIDPANGERNAEAYGQEVREFLRFDEPARAGEWRVATSGAGGYTEGGGELYEIVITATTLP